MTKAGLLHLNLTAFILQQFMFQIQKRELERLDYRMKWEDDFEAIFLPLTNLNQLYSAEI